MDEMEGDSHGLRRWGAAGAFFALVFAVWMFFFPDQIVTDFAWEVKPRLAQAFVGAGYIFRTGFFLAFVRERAWRRLRWAFWGNVTFTGTLLLATFWHADQFMWRGFVAHLWIILYVAEPVTMIFTAPRGEAARQRSMTSGGPVQNGLRWLLILEVAILGTLGALLVINPAFANMRWPWALNPLDARIIAAWFLGWAVWAGAMAFASDWDEIRVGAALNLLFGVAVLFSIVAFRGEFDFSQGTTLTYAVGTLLLTLAMAFFTWRQERARP
jgi:hypothetical protein